MLDPAGEFGTVNAEGALGSARSVLLPRESMSVRLLPFTLLFVLFSSSCGSDSPGDDPHSDAGADGGADVTPDVPDHPGDEDVYDAPDAAVRPRNETCFAPDPPPPPGPAVLTEAFVDPLVGADLREVVHAVYDPRDTDRWYVATRPGTVWMFRAGESTAQVALDISDRVFLGHRETGVMSVAVDPREPYLWLVYGAATSGAAHEGRVARYDLREDGTADADSEVIFLRTPNSANFHNNNHVAFDNDGYLLHSAGDGGLENGQASQDTARFNGKIVRIDPHTPDEARGLPYSIPPDNPFADGEGGAPEVYAWGLRNPWRFGVDPVTGDVWVGDVGQDMWEEIIRLSPGNFGWPQMEGDACFVRAPDCDVDAYELPWTSYPHSDGVSISMGGVYRGAAIPELQGAVVYGDFGNGAIFASREVDGEVVTERIFDSGLNVVGFATDAAGEMYVIDYGTENAARLLRLDPAPSDVEDTFPRLLSETGCVDVADPMTPLPGLFAYEPVAQLWSDGAEKGRILAIPDNRRIEIDEEGDLLLPVGSVLVKHFGFDGVLHETRLLVHHDDGWAGYSYAWREDGSDADLLEVGRTVELSNGLTWVYPSRPQCMECHTAAAHRTLGLELGGLDWDHDGAGATQIDRLGEDEYLAPSAFDDLDNLRQRVPTQVDPFGDAPLADRARSYLHANCAGCHQPDAPVARGNVDLRYATAFGDMNACDVTPEAGTFGLESPRIIVPGEPDRSLLAYRIGTRNDHAMPPLGSRLVDTDGTALIRAWIEGLASCDAP